MKKFSIAFLLTVGLVFAPISHTYAQYGIQAQPVDDSNGSAQLDLTATTTGDTQNTDILNPDILNPSDSRPQVVNELENAEDLDKKGTLGVDDTSTTTGIDNEDIGITGGEPETTGIEHEDIGITGDDTGSAKGMNKASLIETLSASGAASRGNIETEFKVGEDESAKKGGEILIVGSKVRNTAGISEALVSTAGGIEPSSVEDDNDLLLFAVKVANENSGFNEIRIDDSKIVLDYQHGLKLFGIFRVQMRSKATVTFGDGEYGIIPRVKVEFPWWHVFGRKTVRPVDIMSAYDNAAQAVVQYRETDLQFVTRNALALETLGNIMKNVHDPGITILE